MVMELVKVAVGYREEFGKGLGVHPGFVLSTPSIYHPPRGSIKSVLNWDYKSCYMQKT